MSTIAQYSYSGSASLPDPTGSTVWKYWDSESEFRDSCVKHMDIFARQVGYPVMQCELPFATNVVNFESAILEFSSRLNQQNMKDWLLNTLGASTASNFSQVNQIPQIEKIVQLSKTYGTQVGHSDTVDLKKGYIELTGSVQSYDVQALWADVSESGDRLEIQNIYYNQVPASSLALSNINSYGGFIRSLGGGYYADGHLLALSNYVGRTQQLEIARTVVGPAYSFEISNNKVKLFPIPTEDNNGDKLWFEYYLLNEKQANTTTSGSLGVEVSDTSNMRFDTIEYGNINTPAKQWIRKYLYALNKMSLGEIRSKFNEIVVPNNAFVVNGDTLKEEAQVEIDKLIEEINELFEKTTVSAMVETEAGQAENISSILEKVPTKIYLG